MSKKNIPMMLHVGNEVVNKVAPMVGSIVVAPHLVHMRFMQVQRYVEAKAPRIDVDGKKKEVKIYKLKVIAENGSISEIPHDKVVCVSHPSVAENSREFEALIQASDFQAAFKTLYMDLIEETVPEEYFRLTGKKANQKEEDDKMVKVCAVCGYKFRSKAHNAKYCENHRDAKARRAYVKETAAKAELEAKKAQKAAAKRESARKQELDDKKKTVKTVDLSKLPELAPVGKPETKKEEVKTPVNNTEQKIFTTDGELLVAEPNDILIHVNRAGVRTPLRVLEVREETFFLMNTKTNGTGELSRKAAHWVRGNKILGLNYVEIPDEPLQIERWAGVPGIYNGKGRTIASVIVRKGDVMSYHMINHSSYKEGQIYVRTKPTTCAEFPHPGFKITNDEAAMITQAFYEHVAAMRKKKAAK